MADKSSIDKKYWYNTLIPNVISIKINLKSYQLGLKLNSLDLSPQAWHVQFSRLQDLPTPKRHNYLITS